MIIVTGGAGFIGSRIVKGLNARGINDVIVVDDLSDGTKFKNLVGLNILNYVDKDDFLKMLQHGNIPKGVTAIFHQGACSSTTEWDGKFMMKNNYEYSKEILHACIRDEVPFMYASSAAVYGGNETFVEDPNNEAPLNVYGYSKLLFDQYVRRLLPNAKTQIAGFRYFNVYGPNEAHKGSMASVAFHFTQQLRDAGVCRLFEGSGGYGNGEQRRDFVYVDDVVAVNLWFLDNPDKSGIFNVGTGRSQTFNDVANAVLQWHGTGKLEYIPFPEHLKGCYQHFTQADVSALRRVGYDKTFATVAEGVQRYLEEGVFDR